MVFSSVIFLFLFLPLVIAAYFTLPKLAWRNLLLVFASLIFYAWGEKFYFLLMIVSVFANYGIGVQMAKEGARPKFWCALAVVVNLGLLGFYKYGNFLVGNINALLSQGHIAPLIVSNIHLPAGISFFTFHALSYVIDVYRKTVTPQKSVAKLALYFSFFPQLIAGPIVRYHDLEEQLSKRSVTLEDFAAGVSRFCIGLAKKMLIANTLAEVVDQIFAVPAGQLDTGLAWMGIVCYTLQLYFDFSGYSDMAIGLARMFGFRFLENFNYPYISQSIKEFWRRWHISLSNWFRDYLYISLGGNRTSTGRSYLNLVIVFFLCGIWHGASWNFVIWGLFHGMFLVLERTPVLSWMEQVWRPLRHAYVLTVVMVGWVFFRADSLSYALSFLKAMLGHGQGAGDLFHASMYWNAEIGMAVLAGLVAATPILKKMHALIHLRIGGAAPGRNALLAETTLTVLQNGSIAFLLTWSIMKMASGTYNPFIYFRF